MNKQEVYEYLKKRNIPFEINEHPAVFNMEEAKSLDLPYPHADAKNLFLRDDKKNNYYLLSVQGDKRVDLKNLRQLLKSRPLSFANADELLSFLKLTPGSVTPLGLLHDETNKVIFCLDEEFTRSIHLIGIHPNDNSATIWLNPNDLIQIIEEHGNQVKLLQIDDESTFK